MVILAAVRLVTGCATLAKGRLMKHVLLRLFGLIAMATQADIHRVRFRKSWLPAGMRAMAVGAVARRSRMLHLCFFDKFSLVRMASHAQRLHIGLRKHDFPVLGRSVAGVALLLRKWRMHE